MGLSFFILVAVAAIGDEGWWPQLSTSHSEKEPDRVPSHEPQLHTNPRVENTSHPPS
jgi:hypothetical protein